MEHYFEGVLRHHRLPSIATISQSLLTPALLPNFCETECNSIMSVVGETGTSLRGHSPMAAAAAAAAANSDGLTESGALRDRKLNKQEMEKKRRDRINACVDHFKEMLIHVDGQQNSKLEKADVLERMTEYVRELQAQNQELRHQYVTGYRAASSVALDTLRRASLPSGSSAGARRWKDDLERHLSACLSSGMKAGVLNNNSDNNGADSNTGNNAVDTEFERMIKPLTEDNCNRSSMPPPSSLAQLSAPQMAFMERLYQKYLAALSTCEDSVVPSILLSQCEAMLRLGAGDDNCSAESRCVNVLAPCGGENTASGKSVAPATHKDSQPLTARPPVVVATSPSPPLAECFSVHDASTPTNDSGIESSFDASASTNSRGNDTSLKRRRPHGVPAAADESTTTPKLSCLRMWQPFL